ncbi:MAG: histidine kinase [Polaribacter sp.]|nr:histidine kinase [Polaribacter sp.]
MKKSFIAHLKKVPLHLLFWFVVWFFFKAFFSAGTANDDFVFWFSVSLSITSVVGSYVAAYDLMPSYLLQKKYKLFLLYGIYLVVFIACITELVVFVGFAFFYRLEYKEMPALTKSVSVILVCVFFIIALVSVFKLLRYNYTTLEKNKSLENKFLQTKLELKENELKFLKMQIHPHFLFNTLNTLYGFALKKAAETPEMILKLSNLLDYILYQVDKPLVLLKDEIHHIEDYVLLEKMRFHDTLEVTINVEKVSDNFQVAPMLLIPFVENSFKHGAIINGKLRISIAVSTDNHSFLFVIKNSTKKLEKESEGIGLQNIRQRLQMLYNGDFKLEINQKNDEFEVVLKVNNQSLKE